MVSSTLRTLTGFARAYICCSCKIRCRAVFFCPLPRGCKGRRRTQPGFLEEEPDLNSEWQLSVLDLLRAAIVDGFPATLVRGRRASDALRFWVEVDVDCGRTGTEPEGIVQRGVRDSDAAGEPFPVVAHGGPPSYMISIAFPCSSRLGGGRRSMVCASLGHSLPSYRRRRGPASDWRPSDACIWRCPELLRRLVIPAYCSGLAIADWPTVVCSC